MTYNEFAARYAATEQTTDGYTTSQLQQLNETVYAVVTNVDVDDAMIYQIIKSAFDDYANRS